VPPISKRRQIVDDFAARIRDGRLKPGDQLPSTPAIMAEYGVSIITVRNAISQLKLLELIETAPGIGTYVK